MVLQAPDIATVRIRKSGLIDPCRSARECARNLFGIQAQVQQFGEISLWNRVRGLTAESLQERYETHELIKIWGPRTTVHLFDREDWKTVHRVYGYRDNFVIRGWKGNERGLRAALAALDGLTRERKAGRKELAESIESVVPYVKSQYRDYSIIIQATLEGILFGVPAKPNTSTFVHRSACFGDADFAEWKENRTDAMERILTNYFRRYGPATPADFCHWSGLTRHETAHAFKNIEPSLTRFRLGNKEYYSAGDDEEYQEKITGVKLLGKFDPLFVGYADKSWIATPLEQKEIWRPAGHVEAVVLAGGKLAGTWRYGMKGEKTEFRVRLFRKTGQTVKKQIARQAEGIAGFLSKKLSGIVYE